MKILITAAIAILCAGGLYWGLSDKDAAQKQSTDITHDDGTDKRTPDASKDKTDSASIAKSEVAASNKSTEKVDLESFKLDKEMWEQEHGFAPMSMRKTYINYGMDTLVELAGQGDVLAIEMIAPVLDDIYPLELLATAAARGSVSALNAGFLLAKDYHAHYKDGSMTEQEVREKLNIRESTNLTLGVAERILIDAVLMQIRGHITRGSIAIHEVESNILKRKVIDEEWDRVYKAALAKYELLSKLRESYGYSEFDNSYPESYAKQLGIPLENNYLEQIKGRIK